MKMTDPRDYFSNFKNDIHYNIRKVIHVVALI